MGGRELWSLHVSLRVKIPAWGATLMTASCKSNCFPKVPSSAPSHWGLGHLDRYLGATDTQSLTAPPPPPWFSGTLPHHHHQCPHISWPSPSSSESSNSIWGPSEGVPEGCDSKSSLLRADLGRAHSGFYFRHDQQMQCQGQVTSFFQTSVKKVGGPE